MMRENDPKEARTMTVVVLADGEMPRHEVPVSMLAGAQVVVCCDNAYRKWKVFSMQHAVQAQLVYVIGDGDSLSNEEKTLLGDAYLHDPDQDTNDLTKAVHFCFSHGWYSLSLLGATGLREDHTLGNISLLADYQLQAWRQMTKDAAPCLRMVTNHGTFVAVQGAMTLPSFAGQQVSFFCMVPQKMLTVTNMQYAVEHRCFTNWWQGTLNNAMGTSFDVQVEEGGLVLVYQAFAGKEQELREKVAATCPMV